MKERERAIGRERERERERERGKGDVVNKAKKKKKKKKGKAFCEYRKEKPKKCELCKTAAVTAARPAEVPLNYGSL